jgi:hypothetical protein
MAVEMARRVGVKARENFGAQAEGEDWMEVIPMAVVIEGECFELFVFDALGGSRVFNDLDRLQGVLGGVEEQEWRAEGRANVGLIGQRGNGVQQRWGTLGKHGAGTMKEIKLVGRPRHKDKPFDGGIAPEGGEEKPHAIALIQLGNWLGQGHPGKFLLPRRLGPQAGAGQEQSGGAREEGVFFHAKEIASARS